MDAESLEKIIGLFTQLGAQAQWAFIAYLGLQAFKIVAIAGTILTLAVLVLRTIRDFRADTVAWNAIRALFDASWYEHDSVVRKVTELVAKSK